MKRFFPLLLVLFFMFVLTKFLDMSIRYVQSHNNIATTTYGKIYNNIDKVLDRESSKLPEQDEAVLTPTSTPQIGEYLQVINVVDGDTIDVRLSGQKVRVRLIGVNTPESVDKRRVVECFGKEASQKTKDLLWEGLVILKEDASQGSYDKYGRKLAYVYTPGGVLINLELILLGYAHEYTYRIPYEYQSAFKEAERDAREGQRGLWAKGACDAVSDTSQNNVGIEKI